MATRKVKDAKDLDTGELVYIKGHAKATYMSDGRTVEDAINAGGGGGGGIAVETDPIFSGSPAADITEEKMAEWNNKYTKPSGGIPETDLSSDVRSALVAAQSYKGTVTNITINGSTKAPSGGVVDLGSVGTYSKPSTGIPKSDLASDVQSALVNANNAVTREQIADMEVIQTQGFEGSLSGKLYALPDEATGEEDDILLSKNTVKTINGESIFGSGDITIGGSGSAQLPLNNVVLILNGGRLAIPSGKVTELAQQQTGGGTFALSADKKDGEDNVWVIRFAISKDNLGIYQVVADEGYSIKWANGVAPTFEKGKFYELSFRLISQTFLGVWASFE